MEGAYGFQEEEFQMVRGFLEGSRETGRESEREVGSLMKAISPFEGVEIQPAFNC
jgi:hypothetical protein